ncbi:peptide/nickel transport system substrate-binding protein [Variovorax boronicumulans]|uniref:Peptide/nickel transport system substrate-binding protein n=1 Tax=Variovorax boronicumulans TaxID=436515 RepID=A0AAW8CRI3_9BURK|nr:ABC transporter substrate-binding protein [Variovorax boronicumulans]MDP9891921.1 peptide/nickel transport system substrate-binding protein [Variovorax boronicumulans]MDQ0053094.1 peptide/nickel transport system substrate-binding protein [Variovorax boronicumulans]
MTLPPDFTRRRALQLLAAGPATAVAAASTALLAQPSKARAPLQIVGPWEIAGLSPASSGHVFTRMQITETLMNASDDGMPLPGLAERWRVSDDGLAWHFTLRAAARFHDGAVVTAAAVVRCLQAARVAPALLSQAPIRSVEAEGAGVVVIRVTQPYGALPALLAHSSTMVLAPASYAADGAVRSIVGSGPYRVVSMAPPQHVEAAVFDGYDGPRPAIERVRYLAAGRSETRALMAEGGQADLAYGLDPASLVRLRKRGRVQVDTVTLPRTVILKVNATLPALNDVRVRQALSLAIDRPGIAKALLRDPELAATQLFPPTMAAWHHSALPPLKQDPDAAARLLAEAGWRRAPDGLRDASGQPLRLSLRTFPDRPELPLIASALQEQWRQAGIAVQVSIGNSGDIPLGHRDGSLQLGLAARNYATVPDPTGTLMQDFGASGGDWGAMGWRSDAVARALAELSRGTSSAERAAALRTQVTAVLHAELPVIPITWYRQQVAVGRRLEGVSLDPLERSYRLTAMRWAA